MNYEIDFEMPVVHSGHPIGHTEGTTNIKTFGALWWIVDIFLRDQETNQLFKLDKGGPMFREVSAWIEHHKTDEINKLVRSVAA
jgi:hypothetical protein